MQERVEEKKSPQFIKCPYGCGGDIPVGKNNEQALSTHLKSCPNVPQNTAFQETPKK